MELLVNALPFLPATLAPAVALLLAPLLGRRGRTLFAVLLLLIAALFIADVLLLDHSAIGTLEVPNVFPAPDSGQPRTWIVAVESAPGWAWHVCVAAWFGAFGVLLWARRAQWPALPHPLVLGTGLFVAYLAVRLALEKCAADPAIVWATGSTPALLLMLPFLGWHAGRRGYGFRRWIGGLLVLAFLQRTPLIVWGYFATTRHLGTHLDTHLVEAIGTPFGARSLAGDPVRAWIWTTLVPHTTVWVALTVVVGLLLGVLPWWRGRRRQARSPAA
jgi:hypothetical protein